MTIIDKIRKKLETEGCPNCGAKVVWTRTRVKLWNLWRCGDQGCPESLEWTDIYEDAEVLRELGYAGE